MLERLHFVIIINSTYLFIIFNDLSVIFRIFHYYDMVK